jgi:hypothetical protein
MRVDREEVITRHVETRPESGEDRGRWLALFVICICVVVIVLDVMIRECLTNRCSEESGEAVAVLSHPANSGGALLPVSSGESQLSPAAAA